MLLSSRRRERCRNSLETCGCRSLSSLVACCSPQQRVLYAPQQSVPPSLAKGSNRPCVEMALDAVPEYCSGARARRERRRHWYVVRGQPPGACHAKAASSPRHYAPTSLLLTQRVQAIDQFHELRTTYHVVWIQWSDACNLFSTGQAGHTGLSKVSLYTLARTAEP